MTTILVDIKESDLHNLIVLNNLNVHSLNEEGQQKLFNEFPFILYKKRMMGDNMVTIQINLNDYLLYSINNLVK